MQRKVEINGREIRLTSLSPVLDEQFDRLYEALFGGSSPSWDQFTEAAYQYFDNHSSPDAHNNYFNNFTIPWQHALANGSFRQAEQFWEDSLRPVEEWEKSHQASFVHKGTPYYFWAMSALLGGDLDRGYLLIHKAVEEDIRTFGEAPALSAPGYALVSLDYRKIDQAFHQWVIVQARFLEDLLQGYVNILRRTLTLDDVRRRFFNRPESRETVFLLTYTVARLRNLESMRTDVNSTFAGQLHLNLLFDISLVVDTAIKIRQPERKRFIDCAEFLLDRVGHPLCRAELGYFNDRFKLSFEQTLEAALDATLTTSRKTVLNQIQRDVVIAYGLRNRGAHDTSAVPILCTRFSEVRQSVFNTLFAAIDFCY